MSLGNEIKKDDIVRIECLKCQARFLPDSEKERYCSKCKYFLEGIWKRGKPSGKSVSGSRASPPLILDLAQFPYGTFYITA